MHIGLLAPPWIPIPPPAYGGIEQLLALLASELAAAGHDVTLVAAAESDVPGVRCVSPLPRLPDRIGLAWDEWCHLVPGLGALADCDVVIDHSGLLGALLAGRRGGPALHVVHGELRPESRQVYREILAHAPELRLVALSEAQRGSAPELPWAGVCHNAIDVAPIPFSARSEGYLIFLGRMSPDKGAAEAIRIARRAGRPIALAAKCREAAERAYFERCVEPELGPDAIWLGEVGPERKYALLGGADALVFPIDWSEPFGMVMIEAMACGTPVLATARGAVPEVVADGRTGFVRARIDELAETVPRIGEIDRAECRRWVEERFSGSVLRAAYERVITRTTRLRRFTVRRHGAPTRPGGEAARPSGIIHG